MKKDLETKLLNQKYDKLRGLPDFVADFISDVENSTTLRTQLAYIQDINILLEYLQLEHPDFISKDIIDFSPSDINTLTARDIKDFLNYLSSYKKSFKKRDGSEVTQAFSNTQQGKARKLANLHSLFSYLFKNNMIAKDVTANIDIKVDKKASISNKLEGDEIDRFLKTIDDDVNIENNRKLLFHKRVKFRDYIIVLLLAYTGIRVSELIQLDVSDINVDKEAMVVTRKGGNQERIYLPETVLSPIADYMLERKKLNNVKQEYKNALFLSQHGNRIDAQTIRYMLSKYKDRSGLDIKITPHTFRRSFGMEFYNKTKDMYLTAQQLGHTSAETTRKFYAEPTDERKKSSMTGFDYSKADSPTISSSADKNLDIDSIERLLDVTGLSMDELLKKLS